MCTCDIQIEPGEKREGGRMTVHVATTWRMMMHSANDTKEGT